MERRGVKRNPKAKSISISDKVVSHMTVELGFIHITDFNQKFYEQNKDGFDYYDFEHSPKRKNTKFFFIPNPAKLANMILSADISKFPDHSCKGPIERKSHDIRDIQNDKRRKMRKNK